MTIKDIILTALFACCILTSTSCSDFLDIEPDSSQSVTNSYKTESDIKQGVEGVYSALMGNAQYGGDFIYLMEIRSDNSFTESITNKGGAYGDIDLFRETSYNSLLEESWEGCYDGIKRCNLVLDKIDAVEMAEAIKNKYKGEMLFVRGLTYFNLVRLWGDVPLVTHFYDDPFEAFKLGRTPVAEVYQQIEEDLKNAASLLPTARDSKRKGAPIAMSAKALLGKVLLTEGKYADALVVLKEVINSGTYSFMNSYADIFNTKNKNNAESVFEIQYSDAVTDLGSAFANIFAPIGSKDVTGGIGSTEGNNEPTDDLLNAYEDGDVRKDVSIGSLSDGRHYCKKFVAKPVLPNQSDANFIVLRYTDVLMMYAECLLKTQSAVPSEAVEIINKVRSRAGLSPLTDAETSTADALNEALQKERRLEFAFENQRWFDLLRTGKALETMNAAGSNIKNYQLLFPVPQTQIDISPETMKQNAEY